MVDIKYKFESVGEDWPSSMSRKYGSVCVAAKSAIEATANDLKAKARADIGAAGFSEKWRNALRINVYPSGSKASANSALFLYHKIEYSWVFEKGATIRGARLLWIPMPNVPKMFGRSKVTPKQLSEMGVTLVGSHNPGKFPMLFARLNLPKGKASQFAKGKSPTLSASEVKFGSKAGKTAEARVPLFIGVASVNIKARFHILSLCDKAFQDLPGRYFAVLKDE